MSFPSMSAGSSLASRPSRAASDESHIDPESRQGSHVVGEGRTRSGLRRTGATGPYPVPGPSQQSPRYQQSPLPPYGTQDSAPRFGQSSFGQGSLGRPGFSQAPARVLVPPAALSSAFVSSSAATFGPVPVTSSRSQYHFVTQDRNAPIVQPTPRPGVEFIHEGGLPSARRIQGYPQGQSPSSQWSSLSQQSGSNYSSDPKGKGRSM
ncbi:hypothetical protein DFH29DRAFT_58300 [Suillus ampliporus]|nr:hypothetical protein DFH29DRAFT_58300 [Suillus ampliporus]